MIIMHVRRTDRAAYTAGHSREPELEVALAVSGRHFAATCIAGFLTPGVRLDTFR